MENDLQRVAKLQNADEWPKWKFTMRVILNSHNDCFSVVSGKRNRPAEPAPDAEAAVKADALKAISEWDKLDRFAQKAIVTSVGATPLLHIMNCETAADMWEKLLSVYEQKSESSLHLAQQRFYSYTKDPADSIAVHISKVQEITQQLKRLGEEVSESMIITKILMTLPSTYNHFFSAWESTTTGSKTLSNLTARLLVEESRMSSQDSSEQVALVAKKVYPNQKTNVGTKRKVGACFYCKKEGHWKKDCRKLLRDKEMKQKKQSKENSNGSAVGDAFVGEVVRNSDMPAEVENWYVDSGASHHMTSHRGLFVDFEDFTYPLFIRIGDGTKLKSYGKGVINILAFNGQSWVEKHLSNVLYVPELKLNLFSTGAALDKGLQMTSNSKKCEFMKDNVVVAVGNREKHLYKMMFRLQKRVDQKVIGEANVASTRNSLHLWHERLVHQNVAHVKEYLQQRNIIVDKDGGFSCDACSVVNIAANRFPAVHTEVKCEVN